MLYPELARAGGGLGLWVVEKVLHHPMLGGSRDLVSGFSCCFSSGFPASSAGAAGGSMSLFPVHLGTAMWY